MPRSIEKLIGDDEVQRLMFFLQRSDSRDGNDALDPQLLEPVNVGAKVQLTGQNAMAASMARKKRHLASLQRAAHVGVGRRAKRRFHPHFLHLAQPGHGVQPAAADNSDFRLCQSPSRTLARGRSNS